LRSFTIPVPRRAPLRSAARGLENGEHALYDMSVIDAKSSALLTHVSIMLAVIAVLLAQPNSATWKWIYTAELIAFSVVSGLL
jgi:hypothetical protein